MYTIMSNDCKHTIIVIYFETFVGQHGTCEFCEADMFREWSERGRALPWMTLKEYNSLNDK